MDDDHPWQQVEHDFLEGRRHIEVEPQQEREHPRNTGCGDVVQESKQPPDHAGLSETVARRQRRSMKQAAAASMRPVTTTMAPCTAGSCERPKTAAAAHAVINA